MTLLVVSNRLPFTVSRHDERLVFHASPGGLVSGLTAYLDWARQSPSRSEYLLIGFHTIDYTQHFLRCILRILGQEHSFGQVLIGGERTIKVDTFPMGVDYREIRGAAASDDIQKEGHGLRERLGNRKIILSQDRLDYTKGIKHRLEAYAIFLERYPQWQRKVVLVLSVVPSRLGAEHYDQMKEEIDKLVGNINGKYGTIDWTPIVYRYRFLPYNQLLSLFSISDVALVTPLRDGMNLIAKEYVSSKIDQKGV